MDQVEIGDVAMAYDDPYTNVTFLLVMRNALLIPSMDHNLLPPFLIRESLLFLDETPKFQLNDASLDNHCIYDEITGLRIHLHLNGTFSYFETRSLNEDEVSNWENYPVVHLMPDSDTWNPHSLHFADAEAAMMDSNGEIVGSRKRDRTMIDKVEVDVSEMYAEPYMWVDFKKLVDDQLIDDYNFSSPLLDDDMAMMAMDGIWAQVASISLALEPLVFCALLDNQTQHSKYLWGAGPLFTQLVRCLSFGMP